MVHENDKGCIKSLKFRQKAAIKGDSTGWSLELEKPRREAGRKGGPSLDG